AIASPIPDAAPVTTATRSLAPIVAMPPGCPGGDYGPPRHRLQPRSRCWRMPFPPAAPTRTPDPSSRTHAPVLPQVGGAADDEPGDDGSQQADQRRDRAEVLPHVDLQLAQAALLVLEKPLALPGVQPVAEEAPNLGPHEGLGGKGADPDRAHHLVAE